MTVLADDGLVVSAGWLGFLIVVLLGVATFLLIRNMTARLKRLPDRFPADDEADADEDASGPSAGA